MSSQFVLTLNKRNFVFVGRTKLEFYLSTFIRSVTMPDKIVETLGRFPRFPVDKVKSLKLSQTALFNNTARVRGDCTAHVPNRKRYKFF